MKGTKSARIRRIIACTNEIVMGLHSELGPIDPQIVVPVPEGRRLSPAHAILRDFARAKEEIATNVSALAAWTPILRSYSGGLIEFCTQQIALGQEVVAGWVAKYMLAQEGSGVPEEEREQAADAIGKYFGSETSYDRFRTHSRPIRIDELEGLRGLTVFRLEDDPALQDAALSIYHALDLTFQGAAVKIVENHIGKRYVRARQQVPRTLVLRRLQGRPAHSCPAG